MQPISVEAFASMVMKNNKGYRKKELVKTLNETLTAKKNGAKCIICGAPIWAAGSAITGSNLCFTCTTGEANDSDDYADRVTGCRENSDTLLLLFILLIVHCVDSANSNCRTLHADFTHSSI